MKNLFALSVILIIFNLSCTKTEDIVSGDIVINELMPVNSTTIADQDGEFDDWIELYNTKSESKDLSGYYLSDNSSNLRKWIIPQGTTIAGKGFLIVWADKDSLQLGLHSNFKLSSLGEAVIFSDPAGSIVDNVIYPGQTLELSYSRNPDGNGKFKWQNPTFNGSNNK